MTSENPPTTDAETNPASQQNILDFATPAAAVSAFCRAVLSKILPSELFGDVATASKNIKVLHSNIDKFVLFRRFENLTLHDVSQGLTARLLSPASRLAV
jgi:telomerase reverse transcriptase